MNEDRIADMWGARAPHPGGTARPERVEQFLAYGVNQTEVNRWVHSACRAGLAFACLPIQLLDGNPGPRDLALTRATLAVARSAT